MKQDSKCMHVKHKEYAFSFLCKHVHLVTNITYLQSSFVHISV